MKGWVDKLPWFNAAILWRPRHTICFRKASSQRSVEEGVFRRWRRKGNMHNMHRAAAFLDLIWPHLLHCLISRLLYPRGTYLGLFYVGGRRPDGSVWRLVLEVLTCFMVGMLLVRPLKRVCGSPFWSCLCVFIATYPLVFG